MQIASTLPARVMFGAFPAGGVDTGGAAPAPWGMRTTSPTEARRRILLEWQDWNAKQPGTAPRTGVHAAAFYSYLTTDRGAVVQSLRTPIDDRTVHGWLYRNGDVLD